MHGNKTIQGVAPENQSGGRLTSTFSQKVSTSKSSVAGAERTNEVTIPFCRAVAVYPRGADNGHLHTQVCKDSSITIDRKLSLRAGVICLIVQGKLLPDLYYRDPMADGVSSWSITL